MDWACELPADVLKAMEHLLVPSAALNPEAGLVQTCRLASEARRAATAEADDVIAGLKGRVDPFRSIFEAGVAVGAARATFQLSYTCLEARLALEEASGNG